jgi:hypothetical protein
MPAAAASKPGTIRALAGTCGISRLAIAHEPNCEATVRQERKSRLERRVSEHDLHVIGEEEERAEHARDGQEDRQVRAAAVAIRHDSQRQQRVGRMPLPDHEHRQEHCTHDKGSDNDRRAPPLSDRVGAGEHQCNQSAAGKRDSRDIEATAARCAGVAQHHPPANRRDHGDREIDEQAPTP